MTASSRYLASWFLDFPDFVRDQPSGGSCLVGLCFDGMRFSLVCAPSAHFCGSSQPFSLSLAQSWQSHSWSCWWSGCCRGWRNRADVLTRSATVVALCFRSRHRVAALFMDLGSADRWYHAGSCHRVWGDILIAARLVWYFLAVLNILLTSSFRWLMRCPVSVLFGWLVCVFSRVYGDSETRC